MKRLHARHRLDIRPLDIAAGLATMTASDEKSASKELEDLWSPAGSALACYSVRSGFHLLLSALSLPPGTEVLFSAVTHPDMPRLAEHHGLVAVPIDLEPSTLAPRADLVLRATGPRSRVLVVAHLFGGRVDLTALSRLCRGRGILLVEDCAQAFRGPDYTGDPLADVSMFSFGLLKTGSAMGGALLTVRDRDLLERMRRIQNSWPLQRRGSQFKRILQAAAFIGLTRPLPYTLTWRSSTVFGIDFERLVNSAAHAFPTGSTADLVHRLEKRPGAPLLRLMSHRLTTFEHQRLQSRADAGERLAALLPHGLHVGGAAADHTHWLFPVAAVAPEELIRRARAAGFDAARSASSVRVIPAPGGRPDLEPRRAREVMASLVFLPAYPELPNGSLERLAAAMEVHEIHAYASH